jgi:hypothetical protein
MPSDIKEKLKRLAGGTKAAPKPAPTPALKVSAQWDIPVVDEEEEAEEVAVQDDEEEPDNFGDPEETDEASDDSQSSSVDAEAIAKRVAEILEQRVMNLLQEFLLTR